MLQFDWWLILFRAETTNYPPFFDMPSKNPWDDDLFALDGWILMGAVG